MTARQRPARHAFSMIEMVMVVVIMGIIAAIAVPRFADAASGRRLSAAVRIIERDIETVRVRARASARTHVIAFYPEQDMIAFFEGSTIKKDALVHARVLSDDPLGVDLSRTNIGGDETIVVGPAGMLEKSFRIELLDGKLAKLVEFYSDGFERDKVTIAASDSDIADHVIAGVSGGSGLGGGDD